MQELTYRGSSESCVGGDERRAATVVVNCTVLKIAERRTTGQYEKISERKDQRMGKNKDKTKYELRIELMRELSGALKLFGL
jgi:hypothetical protein